MVTTVLVEHPWLTPTALVVVVVAGPIVGAWLAHRRRPAALLGLLSLLPVAALTLVPTDRDLAVGCAWDVDIRLLGAVEPLANLALFVPPALLLAVASRHLGLVLVGASATAAVIEALQALVTALGRSCSSNDWLSNTLGALLGVALGAVALRIAGGPGRLSGTSAARG